ncbi:MULTISPECIES: MurR/RpiR family transcriptional regulator [Enterococcus]|uniref:MurR/RpiR family transcriptional regulator n=1 Tax=Enterococcus alishanensis TaxID=1303817 RepID=A0ABS6TEH5_9ENTE|nr:MurR/RpiR family transcriptional regulator [Enterococcus alishanensis]MBV7391287.1 MurR/RpiR family transcriptional regulator [Enterococcus alishanensis]
MHVHIDRLNSLELKIHQNLLAASKEHSSLTITEAAEIAGVSPSKISKFVKKLGFSGYKEYARFLSGKELVKQKKMNNEFTRIQDFMENFEEDNAEYIAELIDTYDKIILFGYGPTHIALEYFEYKLNYTVDKNIILATQESLIPSLISDKTLLLIFSVAGKFAQFDYLFQEAAKKKAKVLLILEELNTEINLENHETIYLTKSHQSESLNSHEKTRTVFFLVIEEIIQKLNQNKKSST